MIVCPVCEHQQAAGDECESCGKKLVAPTAVAVPTQAMAELEGTRHGGPTNVVAQPMPELEQNRQSTPAQVPTERMQELELNQVVRPGLSVQVEKVADLDVGREAPGPRTAAPTGAVGCRYCGNVQAEGLMCERCGMRLPRAREAAQAAAPGQPGQPGVANIRRDTVWVRCKKCGATARAGERCGDCGHAVPMPEN